MASTPLYIPDGLDKDLQETFSFLDEMQKMRRPPQTQIQEEADLCASKRGGGNYLIRFGVTIETILKFPPLAKGGLGGIWSPAQIVSSETTNRIIYSF